MTRRRTAGFTLLELLVAITLLGLLMVMATAGLRLGARAWDAAEEREHEVYLVQQLLRQRLAAAYVPSEFGPGTTFAALPFEGEQGHVSFLAPLPDLFGTPGLYQVVLELAPTGNGVSDLVMAWQPWRADEFAGERAEVEERDRRVLLAGARAAAFSYFGPDDALSGRSRWQDSWQGRDDLPVLIRLDLARPGSFWPPLIVAPVMRGSGLF